MMVNRETRFGWLLLVAMIPGLASHAAEDSDLERLQRAESDVTDEMLWIEQEIQENRQRLHRLELDLRTSAVTAVALEDARLDEASLRSRESGLTTRLKARNRALSQLDAEVIELQRRIQDLPPDATNVDDWSEQLVELEQHRRVLEGLIANLEQLHDRYKILTGLASQRLALLQARFELPDLSAARQSLGQADRELQRQVDALLSEASTARREAAAQGDTPRDQARRRLLELQAMSAEDRAEFRQLSIVRLQINRVLQSLTAISQESSTPSRVLKSAMRNIGEMQMELQRQRELLQLKRTQFVGRRQIVEQQGSIAAGTDSTMQTRLALIDTLTASTAEQLAEIDALDKRLQSAHTTYASAMTTNARAELLMRRELPADGESRKQLLTSLATLPVRIALSIKDALVDLGIAFAESDLATRAMCVILLLALFLAGWQIRRVVPAKFNSPAGDTYDAQAEMWAPLIILRRNLLSLSVPLSVLGVGLILGLRQSQLVLLLAPLLIWPTVRFALDFSNNLLDEYTPNLGPNRTRVLVLEMRWVVILAAVVAALLVIARAVALSPVVIDALDRLSMLFLLLISAPLFHLRMLLLEGIEADVTSRWLRGVTAAVPALLAVCALIGLFGYGNLAWDIAARLGWLALVGVGVLILRDVLRGALIATGKWFEQRDVESAPSWQQYILGPLYRLVLLLVVLGAVQLLIYLFNWNAQTPIVSVVPRLLESTLFHIGETPIKMQTLGLALLALGAVIWGASWSKQVSYRWLYTGVQDQGIRSSLSTFTQYIFVVLGLVIAMKIIGLDLTALTVFAGALGVGIGFGMQQIVVNFISGILLLIERPLATTDMVNVDKYEGEVTRIGIRSLTIKTFDNQEVILPNSAVITQPFINWTRSDDIMRTVLMVGISYDDDPEQAVALIKEQVLAHPAVLEDPGIKVLLWEFADSALMIRIHFHTRVRGEIGRADVRSQILFAIWNALKDAGITIPYPQRDVHLISPANE